MTPPEIAEYPLAELDGWDEFNESSSQGTVFSSTRWLNAFSEVTGSTVTVMAAHDNGKLQCGIPLVRHTRVSVPVGTSNPLSPYNGIILSDTLVKESQVHESLTDMLARIVKYTRYVSLSLHPSFDDMRPFMRKKWQVRKLYTYWVDITSEEAFWKNFSQSLRRKIRRAEDDGIRITEYADEQLIATQYAYSYRRHGIREPIPLERIAAWAGMLLDAGLARMFVAYDKNDQALASRLVIPDAPFVYDWLAGSSEKGDTVSANHTLVTRIMDAFSQEGCSTFDFRGANTPGVIEFKRAFGGLLMSYAEAVYRGSWLLRNVENLKNLVTEFRRRTL